MQKAFPLPVIEFPLPGEVPIAREESFHCQKKGEAIVVKIALLLKSRRNCQSKSDSSYTNAETTDTSSDGTGKNKGRTVTLIADDMQKRKNDVKARTTLLLSLPDKHQLRFSKHKTTQELWAAILKTFGGNEATKKTKKNLLKQQYGNFKAEGSKNLEQTFNRLQKKSKTNSQNMAFISSVKHSRGIKEVNTSSVSTASTNVPTASANIGIDEDDMADRFWKKTRKKISIQGTDVVGFNKSKVEYFNCHKMGHFARECRAPRSQDRRRRDNYRQGSKVEEQAPKALMAINGVGWDWSYMVNDEENHALIADEETLIEFALMAKTSAKSEDLSWTGLPEFKDDTVTDYSRPSPAIESTLDHAQNINPSVSENEASPSTISPKSFIKFVKANESPTNNKTDKAETTKKSPIKKRVKIETSRSQNNTHKSLTPRPVVYRPNRSPVRPVRTNMNGARPNRTSFNNQAHSYTNRPFQRTSAVRSQYKAPWVPTVNRNFSTVRRKFPTANRKVPTGSTKFSTADMGKKENAVKASACWIWKPRQNTVNKDPNSNSISVMFKKYKYIDTQECIVLGRDFKLLDDANVLLRTPRQHNMYSIDLNNIVPHKDLTCLVAKASVDECINWHMRLGHLNFKTMNRCDNGGEFRNKEMNGFCSQKGIKREFSNARTPQQNGVAERRNRTLIEVARTMLADAKLPFEAKEDEGYFIRYSMSSKAFRVFNKRTKRVEENLHIEFFENKAIEKGAGPNWLFDIDSLTKSINYLPVVDACINSTNFLGTKDVAGQEVKKDVSTLRYIALPNWAHDALLESSSSKTQDDCSTDVPESSGNSNPTATLTNPPTDQVETLTVETSIPIVSSPVLTACFTNSQEPSSDTRLISKRVANQVETPSLDNILTLKYQFENILGVTIITDESNGVEGDVSNKETSITASPTTTLRIHKDHPKSQIIGPLDTPIQTRNKSKENIDFHLIVDFVEASHIRYALTFNPTIYVSHIRQFWSTARIETTEEGTKILATVDGNLRTITESSIRRNLKLNDEAGISSLPDTELFENLTLMGYNISPNQKFTFQKGFNEFSSNIATALVCLATNRTYKFSKIIFDGMVKNVNNKIAKFLMYPRARIAQSLALPLIEAKPASPLRDVSQGEACPTDYGFVAYQDKANIARPLPSPMSQHQGLLPLLLMKAVLEIIELKARVKFLEDRQGEGIKHSRDDALIKGRRLDEGEAVTERLSSDIEEIRLDKEEATAKRVSHDTEEMATILTLIDAASVLSSGGVQVVPIGAVVSTATVSIPTGSGVVPTTSPTIPTVAPIFATATTVTPYTSRKGKEKIVETDTPKKKKRLQEQIDVQFARELEEELEREAQRMNVQISRDEDIAKIHAEEELQKIETIELINELVKYQDHRSKILQYQAQQRKPRTKKQKMDYYSAVIKSYLGWKIEDFIPMGSKEEAVRFKRKGIRFEQESAKKMKTSEEVPKEVKSTEEVPEEKVKEMIQLVPIEEVYVESLQVKHPIVDWKHLDREDLNQLWGLVKETLSIRPATNEKEMELWVELKRLYEPNADD
uniref:Ribonuclease H-like domain-containing protein n=1 Tax=Tanacetum cinerariifolium TaxID=118510 RepID=A0A6L2LYW7_TANCI|nr:ribonuclease H-like domain-containing protein [Tanacetum cinerariifolium]